MCIGRVIETIFSKESMKFAKNKVAQDMTTPTGRVFWSEEERATLHEAVLESFRSSGSPYSEWKVTTRMLMKAQIEYLDEKRFRDGLADTDVKACQDVVDAFIYEHEVQVIVRRHNEYKLRHGKTPFQHIEELQNQIAHHSTMVRRAADMDSGLQARVRDLTADVDVLRARVSTLSEDNQRLTGELGASKLALKDLANRKPPVPPVPLREQPLPPAPKLPMFVATSKLSNEFKNKLIKLNPDIVFLEAKDTAPDIKRKSINRVVVSIEGHLPTELARVARDNSKEYLGLTSGGQSLLVARVQERMLKNMGFQPHAQLH